VIPARRKSNRTSRRHKKAGRKLYHILLKGLVHPRNYCRLLSNSTLPFAKATGRSRPADRQAGIHVIAHLTHTDRRRRGTGSARVLAAILGQNGHTVSTADSAAEALMRVDEQDFDVVFTDLAMPKTDGVTTAAEIKSRKPATKVVLMSGYRTERAYERAVKPVLLTARYRSLFELQDINETLIMLLH
jgi:CheY-like chemotaxis protein